MLNATLKCSVWTLGIVALALVPFQPLMAALVALVIGLILALSGPNRFWQKRRYGWRVKRKLLRFWLWLLYGKAHEFRHELWSSRHLQ